MKIKPSLVKLFVVAITVLATLSACVTSSNDCGNEGRDWNNLNFPKDSYCSVPEFVPLREHFEAANKAVCKVHDNNRGIASTMSRREADWRFLCDYIKRSELPWGIRHTTGYLSYLAVRITATDDKPLLPLVPGAPDKLYIHDH